mgnify:FL=1
MSIERRYFLQKIISFGIIGFSSCFWAGKNLLIKKITNAKPLNLYPGKIKPLPKNLDQGSNLDLLG